MEVSVRLHALAAYRQGKNTVFHWIGSRVGSRVVLDALEERKVCSSNPGTSVPSPTAKPRCPGCPTWPVVSRIINRKIQLHGNISVPMKRYNTSKAKRLCVAILFRTCTRRMPFPYIGRVIGWPDSGLLVSFLIWNSRCVSTNKYTVTVNTTKPVDIPLTQHVAS